MIDTSAEAFESIDDKRQAMYMQILHKLAKRDATCDEIEVALTMRHQTASARFTELREQEYVDRTGKTRPTRSGRSAHVYTITILGESWLQLIKASNKLAER